MPANLVSKVNAIRYKWGGPTGNDCDGWHLVQTPKLSIIEETMPPNTSETRHQHAHARQFFYVIEGELTMEIERQFIELHPGEGVEIAPGQPHQAINRTAGAALPRYRSASKPR
jgi:quercetin dioxygenase-like cupin family protein